MNIVKSQNHITRQHFSLLENLVLQRLRETWREKNPTAQPNMDPNKLATMQRTIIKNKYLSEMEIDEINLTFYRNA